MDGYDLSVEIDRPPDVVWAFVSDLRRWPEWRTTIRSIEPPDELAAGAAFAGTTRLLGRTWTWGLELTAVDPPRHLAYRVTEGVAIPTVGYLVEPSGAGTRFTMSGHIDDMGVVARLLKPVALRALRRETRTHLGNLKALVEGPGG